MHVSILVETSKEVADHGSVLAIISGKRKVI